MSNKIINAEWKLLNKRYTFMEAINSNKKIKHEDWENYTAIQEALYNLLDFKIEEVIEMINGPWNIEE